MNNRYALTAQTRQLIQPIKDAITSVEAQVVIANELSPIKVDVAGLLNRAWLEINNADQDLRCDDLENARRSIGIAQESIQAANKRVREALQQMLEGAN